MDWNGFTDEELQKIENKHTAEHASKDKQQPKTGRHAKNLSKGPAVGPKVPIAGVRGPIVGPASLSNPAQSNREKQNEFLLSIKKENGHVTRTHKEEPNNTVEQDNTHNGEQVEQKKSPNEEKKEVVTAEVDDENPFKPDSPPPAHITPQLLAEPAPSKPNAAELAKPADPAEPANMSKLEVLQRRQCELEENNKKREKELSKTISEKFAATAEQARLLSNLKNELGCVEQSITSDICILRDRIDHSNRECYNASKRYEAAEAEYVASKLALHCAEERKEGLQEHLFTIIQMNETKKSQKLEELMSKLELAGISSPPPT